MYKHGILITKIKKTNYFKQYPVKWVQLKETREEKFYLDVFNIMKQV